MDKVEDSKQELSMKQARIKRELQKQHIQRNEVQRDRNKRSNNSYQEHSSNYRGNYRRGGYRRGENNQQRGQNHHHRGQHNHHREQHHQQKEENNHHYRGEYNHYKKQNNHRGNNYKSYYREDNKEMERQEKIYKKEVQENKIKSEEVQKLEEIKLLENKKKQAMQNLQKIENELNEKLKKIEKSEKIQCQKESQKIQQKNKNYFNSTDHPFREYKYRRDRNNYDNEKVIDQDKIQKKNSQIQSSQQDQSIASKQSKRIQRNYNNELLRNQRDRMRQQQREQRQNRRQQNRQKKQASRHNRNERGICQQGYSSKQKQFSDALVQQNSSLEYPLLPYFIQDVSEQSKQSYYSKIDFSLPLYPQLNALLSQTFHHAPRRPFFFKEVDIHPDGFLRCVYTGIQLISPQGHVLHPCNQEHSFPQSFQRGTHLGTGRDMHALFAASSKFNDLRGNMPFGDKGTLVRESPHGRVLKDKVLYFCPARNRGAVARATLYVLTAYRNVANPKYLPRESVEAIVRWAVDEEVTLWEKHRNQVLFRMQGNRNPFVDMRDIAGKIDFSQGWQKK